MSSPVSGQSRRGRRTIQSVDRALLLLEVLASESGGLSLTELGRRVCLPVQTVQSLLRTLQAHDLVYQSGRGACYECGPGLELLGAARHSRRERALLAEPVVRDLVSRIGETVLLAELSGSRVVGLVEAQAERALRVHTTCEIFSELHTMATGKLLLAHLPAVRRDAIVEGLDLATRTAHTITDRAVFRQHLDAVRQRGFAENVDESEIGVAALAVGVRGESGQIRAALGTCLPCVRYSAERRSDLLGALRRACEAVESAWRAGDCPASGM